MSHRDVGDRPRWVFTFRNYAGELADPPIVRVVVKPPTGSEVEYVYGTDSEVERLSVGVYRFALPLTASKTWNIRFHGMSEPEPDKTIVASDVAVNVRATPIAAAFPTTPTP